MHAVLSLDQVVPEGLHVIGVGELAGHADHSNSGRGRRGSLARHVGRMVFTHGLPGRGLLERRGRARPPPRTTGAAADTATGAGDSSRIWSPYASTR